MRPIDFPPGSQAKINYVQKMQRFYKACCFFGQNPKRTASV